MNRRFILIPYLEIQNANALSTPLTIGFPAMTAWLGGVHALERKLKNVVGYEKVKLESVGIVVHDFKLHSYKGQGDFVHSIVAMRHPLKKDGSTAAFVEEARCHLTVSLVIECKGIGGDSKESEIVQLLNSGIKFAGGDILGFGKVKFCNYEADKTKKLLSKMMPGFALIDRSDLVRSDGDKEDELDSLLDHLKISYKAGEPKDGKADWFPSRKVDKGWFVPIAVGFHGLTGLSNVKNQRDPGTKHRFAESVITLGEFVMPYKVDNIDNILWHYEYDEDRALYLCKQNKQLINN